MNNIKISWEKYFDKIYCVHYVPFEDRYERLCKELAYVDILDSPIFEWELVYNNEKILNIIKESSFNKNKKNIYSISNTLAQYNCWNKAAYHKYNRTLILEDDIVFRTDKEKIIDILEHLPKNYDVCLFDYVFANVHEQHKLNKELSNFIKRYIDTNYYGVYKKGSLNSCYAISERYASYITKEFGTFHHSCIEPPDEYMSPNEMMDTDKCIKNYNMLKFKSIYAKIPIAMQKEYYNSNNSLDLKRRCTYTCDWVDLNENLNFDDFIKNEES